MNKSGQLIIVEPGEGQKIDLGGIGVDFKIWGHQTGGGLSIVEHPIEARRLVPPHVHSMEDELSYVLQGRVGIRVGDELAEAGTGAYIYKPCGIPHTFWNPTDKLARLLEIIYPAGFEEFFAESDDLFRSGAAPGGPEHAKIAKHYRLSFFTDWVSELKERFNLKLLGEP